VSVSRSQDVRAFYDDTADSYDRMMDGEITHPLYAGVLGGLAERITGVSGPVLDSSCGTGHMLAELAAKYAPGRELLGVDLSPKMVSIAQARLGSAAAVYQGDMAALPAEIPDAGCAAVISFFSLHHIGASEIAACISAWNRALVPGGQLTVATWEGEGAIDYGGQSDMVTQRYRESELVAAAESAGLMIDRCSVEPVEGMEMDAVYLDATKCG